MKRPWAIHDQIKLLRAQANNDALAQVLDAIKEKLDQVLKDAVCGTLDERASGKVEVLALLVESVWDFHFKKDTQGDSVDDG